MEIKSNQQIEGEDIPLKYQVLSLLNQLRSQPSSFIPILQSEIKYFSNLVYKRKKELPIKTIEGDKAYLEAIDYLKTVNAVNELEYNDILEQCASDLLSNVSNDTQISHIDNNGLNVSDRVDKYLEWENRCSENIEIGSLNAQDIIVNLLVDDGNKNRNRRNNLFYDDLKYFGFACVPHYKYQQINVIVTTGNLRDKGTLYFDYSNYKYTEPENIYKKVVNDFQYDDPDAPDDTVSFKIKKEFKEKDNRKKVIVVKKYYQLKNGDEHIIETEEF